MAAWANKFDNYISQIPAPPAFDPSLWETKLDGSIASGGKLLLDAQGKLLDATRQELFKAATGAVGPALQQAGFDAVGIGTWAPAAGALVAIGKSILGGIFGEEEKPIRPMIAGFEWEDFKKRLDDQKFPDEYAAIIAGVYISGGTVDTKDLPSGLGKTRVKGLCRALWEDALKVLQKGGKPKTGFRKLAFFAAATDPTILSEWTKNIFAPQMAALLAYGVPRLQLRIAMADAAMYNIGKAWNRQGAWFGVGKTYDQGKAIYRFVKNGDIAYRLVTTLFPLPSADVGEFPATMPTRTMVEKEKAYYHDKDLELKLDEGGPIGKLSLTLPGPWGVGYGVPSDAPRTRTVVTRGFRGSTTTSEVPISCGRSACVYSPYPQFKLGTAGEMIDRAYQIALTHDDTQEYLARWKTAMAEIRASQASLSGKTVVLKAGKAGGTILRPGVLGAGASATFRALKKRRAETRVDRPTGVDPDNVDPHEKTTPGEMPPAPPPALPSRTGRLAVAAGVTLLLLSR